MKVLLIAEHDNHTLQSSVAHLVTAALKWQGTNDLLVIGHACQAVAKTASSLTGVTRVLCADAPCYEHQLPENSAALVASLGQHYDVILAPASTFGKNLLPRVAALLDTAMLSDIVQWVDQETFVRPIYAGSVFETVKLQEKIKILTVRTTAFEATPLSAASAPIDAIEQPIENNTSRFEARELTPLTRPALSDARVVVSGGR